MSLPPPRRPQERCVLAGYLLLRPPLHLPPISLTQADPVCKRLLDQQHVLQREKHDSALSQQQQKEQELQLSASHDAWQGAQAAELQLITTHGPRSTASAANQKNNQDDNQQRLGERTNTANSFALHGSDAVAAGTLDDAFAAGGDDDDDSGGRGGERATPLLRLVAGAALLVEAVAGMYLPAALQVLRSPQWYLSLLNCFSGGVFLAAGAGWTPKGVGWRGSGCGSGFWAVMLTRGDRQGVVLAYRDW